MGKGGGEIAEHGGRGRIGSRWGKREVEKWGRGGRKITYWPFASSFSHCVMAHRSVSSFMRSH